MHHQVPVPLRIFRSDMKFNHILQCSGLKYAQTITLKLCTCHERPCYCWNMCKILLWTRAERSCIEFNLIQNIFSGRPLALNKLIGKSRYATLCYEIIFMFLLALFQYCNHILTSVHIYMTLNKCWDVHLIRLYKIHMVFNNIAISISALGTWTSMKLFIWIHSHFRLPDSINKANQVQIYIKWNEKKIHTLENITLLQ